MIELNCLRYIDNQQQLTITYFDLPTQRVNNVW